MTPLLPKRLALIGRARAGKDSVAARLVSAHGYTRVAFADPLKDAALALDPLVYACTHDGYEVTHERLSEVVEWHGWEQAKDQFPEVRRTLQALGQSIRDLDSRFWLRMALQRIADTDGPVIVTDCRYRNEADALRLLGFTLVRVHRPGLPASKGEHVSETELDGYPTSLALVNGGSLADLRAKADALA